MLLGRTRGELSLAVGAYNAGLDPVERWRSMLRGGPPEIVLEAAAFGETRLYMWSVLDDWIDVRRCLGLPMEDPI
jgi:soluble lytic murein transglycosylase-like protein